MEDIFVARLMSTDLVTVTADTLVEDAAQLILDNSISSLVVVDDDNNLVGILTTTDFVEIVAKSQPKAQTTVERYMTTDVITASAQDPITDVAESMISHGFHHMPVVDDDEGVIGIITTSDLAAYVSQVGQMANT
ncbi:MULTISPECIES: CBS domain-containing protein [Haloferax]|uniref:CBS domain-containing protein n=1 Tax=Haloferax marinum TaxID=2666143 RepID=A0A6A8GC23_9EURY|nr:MULTISPECIES: CBS domain-containing protein [Haloferax]KAB1191218.1 CBS domain-containing protein [Haloferax sp. CBA1150]MRW98108.1 CBS domain-containing protein [Haloferax marinum]